MRRPKAADENFQADSGSKGNVPLMVAKSCTDEKSRYLPYRDFRGTLGTPSSDGVPYVPRRLCGSLLLLVVRPEDPISAGNLSDVLGLLKHDSSKSYAAATYF